MEEKYNDLLRKGREVVSERYTPQERRGIEVGGRGLEIGVLLVGGCVGSGGEVEGLDPYDREEQRREAQEAVLECWSKENGCWFENTNVVLSERFPFLAEGGEADVYFDGNRVIKAIGLDYFVSPQMALDRIVLHNFLFEYSTPMRVMGYGRNGEGYFKVVVEQPYIRGERMSEEEIEEYLREHSVEVEEEEAEAIYLAALQIVLVDGVLGADEVSNLLAIASTLGIDDEVAILHLVEMVKEEPELEVEF
jgi:hypothetical protein